MAQLLIRKLDESVVARLKETAEVHGHSLEQEAREILTKAVKLTNAQRLELSKRLRAETRWLGGPDSTALIRADRDSR